MRLIDITGMKFGRLTVIRKMAPRQGGGSHWLCACDCGNECVRVGSRLRGNGTSSCGCYQLEWAKEMGANAEFVAKRAGTQMKHGAKRRGAKTPEYQTWLRMKSRCYRITDPDYPTWGGRGIRVCDRWLNDFAAFLSDMGPKPGPEFGIDRLKSDEDYGPGNCRWATQATQGAENRRGLVAITVGGVTFPTIAEACRHFGVGATTVNERLRAGIPADEAFTPPGSLPPRRTRESYLRKDRR